MEESIIRAVKSCTVIASCSAKRAGGALGAIALRRMQLWEAHSDESPCTPTDLLHFPQLCGSVTAGNTH